MDNITPETLYQELSKTVIGQEGYLKSLCNAAWLHNLRYQHYKQTGEVLDKPKQNFLCIGSSGTGKTLAVEQLGKLLDGTLAALLHAASTLPQIKTKLRQRIALSVLMRLTKFLNPVWVITVSCQLTTCSRLSLVA